MLREAQRASDARGTPPSRARRRSEARGLRDEGHAIVKAAVDAAKEVEEIRKGRRRIADTHPELADEET
jgi:hypothetical protein